MDNDHLIQNQSFLLKAKMEGTYVTCRLKLGYLKMFTSGESNLFYPLCISKLLKITFFELFVLVNFSLVFIELSIAFFILFDESKSLTRSFKRFNIVQIVCFHLIYILVKQNFLLHVDCP